MLSCIEPNPNPNPRWWPHSTTWSNTLSSWTVSSGLSDRLSLSTLLSAPWIKRPASRSAPAPRVMVVTTVAARATSGASAALPTSQAARHLASVSLPKRKVLLRCPALFRAGDPLLPDLDPVDPLPDLDPLHDLVLPLPDLDPPLLDQDPPLPDLDIPLACTGEPSAWVAGLAPAAPRGGVFLPHWPLPLLSSREHSRLPCR